MERKEFRAVIKHFHMEMRKLSARWVPCLLLTDQTRNRAATSKQCLTMFKHNSSEFLRSLSRLLMEHGSIITHEEGEDGAIGRKGNGNGEGKDNPGAVRSIYCTDWKGNDHIWQRKKVLFHHDAAPAYLSGVAAAKLVELRYELLPHPPNLATWDFFLFPKMKKSLAGKKYRSGRP